MTLAQMIARLTRGYIKATGKQPVGLDKLKIKMEAAEKLRQMNKVILFPQQRSFKEEINSMVKSGDINVGTAPKTPPYQKSQADIDFEIMERIKSDNEKAIRGFESRNPKKPTEDKADGGVAGLLGERQNFAMGKRAFLKLMGGIGAGIAGLKSGLLGFGKGATKKAVTETLKQSAGSGTVPPYFLNLVSKIKNLGDEAPRLATKDREKVTTYKDYTLTEDVTTGEQTIQRMKVLDDGSESYYGKPLTEETYMSYKPGKGQADETMKGKTPPDEYEEGTALLRNDKEFAGEVVDESATISDDVIKEGTVFEDTISEFGKADGGRIGYNIGGLSKLGKIMAGINKKFGKGTMTTADKIAQPEKTIQQRIMEFEARNKPDAITIEPRKFIDVPPMPKGFKLSREKLEKNYPELDEDMIDQIMELDKEMQGTVLTMLKNRRKNPDAYDKLLETKGDTLEFQGAFDEVTRKSNNADGGRIGLSTGGLANMLGE